MNARMRAHLLIKDLGGIEPPSLESESSVLTIGRQIHFGITQNRTEDLSVNCGF